MNPATPADKYPAGTAVIDDETDAPAQRAPAHAPGPRQTNVDNRPHHAKVEPADEWVPINGKSADARDALPPLNSPDEPFALKLRRPIMSSKGVGGKVDTLVISPPRVDAFVSHGAFVRSVSEDFRNERTGETKTVSYAITDYAAMVRHLATATGVPAMELNGLSAADAERAGAILFQMSRGTPFR